MWVPAAGTEVVGVGRLIWRLVAAAPRSIVEALHSVIDGSEEFLAEQEEKGDKAFFSARS